MTFGSRQPCKLCFQGDGQMATHHAEAGLPNAVDPAAWGGGMHQGGAHNGTAVDGAAADGSGDHAQCKSEPCRRMITEATAVDFIQGIQEKKLKRYEHGEAYIALQHRAKAAERLTALLDSWQN